MRSFLKIAAVAAFVAAPGLNGQNAGTGADMAMTARNGPVIPTVMQTKVVAWSDKNAAFVNVLKGRDGNIYQICLARYWGPRPEPSFVSYKDVSALALNQAGDSIPLTPMYKKYSVMMESGGSCGSTSNGLFIAALQKGFVPEAIKLTWDGATRTLPLEPVKQ